MFEDAGMGAWVATLAVVLTCAWLALGLLQRRREGKPTRLRLKRFLIWNFSLAVLAFLVWLGETWAHATATPHVITQGSIQVMQRIVYRGDEVGIIGCVPDCKQGLLNFTPQAVQSMGGRAQNAPVKVAFLEQPKEISKGMFGFDVVDIWDSKTGQSLYHVDTAYHPLQTVLLLIDVLALATMAWICAGLPEAEPEEEVAQAAPPDSAEMPATGSLSDRLGSIRVVKRSNRRTNTPGG